MNILIIGGAGFIGSSLAESLLVGGHAVTILDNFSAGNAENLGKITDRIRIIKGDCKSQSDVKDALKNQNIVFHFAANPEVRIEFNDSQTCFRENIYATHILMEELAKSAVKKIIFASTSTVYGEPYVIPTSENYGEMKPISYYGASKLASEALICSYCAMNKKQSIILRFANVIGPRSRHGVVFDFVSKIRKNAEVLEVLGDGKQVKSYLHVDDCLSAIMKILESEQSSLVSIYNVGSEDKIEVAEIAKIVIEAMGTQTKIVFTGGIDGGRGWNGDVKIMQLDISKMKMTGWFPKFQYRLVWPDDQILHPACPRLSAWLCC